MDNPLSPELRDLLDAARKSFTPEQEEMLIQTLPRFDDQTRLLCELMYLTGCRISEAIRLKRSCLDTERALVVFYTLKQHSGSLPKRRLPQGWGSIRAVPLPRQFVHWLADLPVGSDGRLFPFSRWTALRRVKAVLAAADIRGPLANSKTFRHSYNDRGKRHGITGDIRCSLLGHRNQSSNNHYGALLGDELRDHAKQMWGVCATLYN